jgi:hypothetical protein
LNRSVDGILGNRLGEIDSENEGRDNRCKGRVCPVVEAPRCETEKASAAPAM